MRYNLIREIDISNADGISVSLFVQGCSHHCPQCFNPETWGYDGGKLWTKDIEDNFLKLIDKPYINSVSILGGEPIDQQEELYEVLKKVNKPIWLWSGYLFEEIKHLKLMTVIDILVDGKFEVSKKDHNLKYRGSSNQRVIDVCKSLRQNKTILFEGRK